MRTILFALFLSLTSYYYSDAADSAKPDISLLETRVKNLEQKIDDLSRRQTERDGDVSWLSVSSIPIGTVVAFTGASWPPNNPDPQGKTWTEDSLGWMLCDGRPLSRTLYKPLYIEVGTTWGNGDGATTFNIPDLRGHFLRGVTSSRNDAYALDPARPRTVGSIQKPATALPTTTLNISEERNHHHSSTVNNNLIPIYNGVPPNYAGSHWPIASITPNGTITGDSGAHTHTISGGDPETHPVNAAVNWIIRVK